MKKNRDATDSSSVRIGRRRMLTAGAMTAAGAGAAALMTPATASAAPGDPLKIDDATNVGAGTTKLNGSSVTVSASNADVAGGTAKAAVVGQPAAGSTASTGVVGIGAGSNGPGLAALNPTGPQLYLGPSDLPAFPPATGKWLQGSFVNAGGFELFQCIYSDEAANSRTTWVPLNSPEIILLDAPFRVYGSTSDARGKIVHNTVRQIDVTQNQAGQSSGVPSDCLAVIGTVQLYATETTSGWLAVGSGDIARPAGYSTAVWSAANFAGTNFFMSRLGADVNPGTLSIACYGSATTKTHFFVDIVGYYDFAFFVGNPGAASPTNAPQARARQNLHKRAKAKHR